MSEILGKYISTLGNGGGGRFSFQVERRRVSTQGKTCEANASVKAVGRDSEENQVGR